MIIDRKYLLHILYSVTLLLLTFRVTILLVVVCPVAILFLLKEIKTKIAGHYLLCIFLFYFFYVVFCELNGNFLGSEGRSIYRFILPFFLSSIFSFLIAVSKQFDFKKLLLSYAVLSLSYGYLLVIYSMLNGYIGYGEIYDFFYGSKVNSPIYAILITVCSIIVIDFCWSNQQRGLLFKSFVILSVSLTLIFCVTLYLGSRSSFIMLGVYFVLRFLLIKNTLQRFILFSFIFCLFFFVVFSNFDFFLHINFGGFESRGYDSPRFALMEYGFTNIFDYPFGGLSTYYSNTSYEGRWFHNVYLDIVSRSGYLVMFVFLFMQALIFVDMFRLFLKRRKTYFIIFFVFSLAIFQDLAFDGHYNFMAIFFLFFGGVYKLRLN